MFDIKVALKKTDKVLPYDYYYKMHGFICNLLGNNFYCSMQNNYIYSNLMGGDYTKDGIVFKEQPYFFIRTDDDTVLANFLNSLSNNKTKLFEGFEIEGFMTLLPKIKTSYFRTVKSSPILVSKTFDKKDNLSNDDLKETEKYLVESVIRHAKEYNVSIDENLTIEIIRQHKHKDILYKETINKGRVFELKINANKETKEFIISHGIGRSTGSGFGFLI